MMMKMKRTLLIGLALLSAALIAAGCGSDDADSSGSSSTADAKTEQAKDAAMEKKDAMEEKAAMEKAAMEKQAMEKVDAMEGKDAMTKHSSVEAPHFVSSAPANDSSAPAGSVKAVAITFDFDLGAASKIEVTAGGADMTTGPTTIVGDNLKLMVPVNTSKAVTYDVAYTACWPDGSCHDGSFSFTAT